MGTTLNKDKTKCMVIAKEKGGHWCDILVTNKPITQMQSVEYFEFILAKNGRCRNGVSRIA